MLSDAGVVRLRRRRAARAVRGRGCRGVGRGAGCRPECRGRLAWGTAAPRVPSCSTGEGSVPPVRRGCLPEGGRRWCPAFRRSSPVCPAVRGGGVRHATAARRVRCAPGMTIRPPCT